VLKFQAVVPENDKQLYVILFLPHPVYLSRR